MMWLILPSATVRVLVLAQPLLAFGPNIEVLTPGTVALYASS